MIKSQEITDQYIKAIQQELINDLITIRKCQGISQKKLEEISNEYAKKEDTVIARLEKHNTSPNLITLQKLVSSLGFKLTLTPISK